MAPPLTRARPQAWLTLAEELGKVPPPAFMLKKAVGMKSSQARRDTTTSHWPARPSARRRRAARPGSQPRHARAQLHAARELAARNTAPVRRSTDALESAQVVSEVFCWAREPMAVRKLAARKDELMEKAMVRGGVHAALRAASLWWRHGVGRSPLARCSA